MSKDKDAAPEANRTPIKTLEAAGRALSTCMRSGSDPQRKAAKEDLETYQKQKQSYLDGWSYGCHRFPQCSELHHPEMFARGVRDAEAYIPIAAALVREEKMKEEQFARMNGQ
jgi:hypothetical protein